MPRPEAIPLSRLPHGPEAILLTAAARDAEAGVVRGFRERADHAPSLTTPDGFLPGCLLVELMAQTAGLGLPEGGGAVVAAMTNVRLRREPASAERVDVKAHLDRHLGALYVFSCRASASGEILADGEITLRRT
ncbi:MAG: hypothetical protein HY049_00830 [Acidobacteria bacterium]|nr:hypothetical protein [Acidobacteriota bacterium]